MTANGRSDRAGCDSNEAHNAGRVASDADGRTMNVGTGGSSVGRAPCGDSARRLATTPEIGARRFESDSPVSAQPPAAGRTPSQAMCELRYEGNECHRPEGHSGLCYDERTRVAFEEGWWGDDKGNSGRTPSSHERCHEQAAESYDHGYLDGLRAAREAVARQTDLAELVHFERPSDFRKGVLTCVVALDNEIKVVTDA